MTKMIITPALRLGNLLLATASNIVRRSPGNTDRYEVFGPADLFKPIFELGIIVPKRYLSLRTQIRRVDAREIILAGLQELVCVRKIEHGEAAPHERQPR